MIKKIKEFKIYIIIAGFLALIFQCIKIGQNKEQLKQFKRNEKIKKKRDKIKRISSRKQLVNKLHKGKF